MVNPVSVRTAGLVSSIEQHSRRGQSEPFMGDIPSWNVGGSCLQCQCAPNSCLGCAANMRLIKWLRKRSVTALTALTLVVVFGVVGAMRVTLHSGSAYYT